VTALTNRKIIAAKRTLSVVTSHATLAATRGVMIERLRRGDLSSLRHSCSDLMTLSTDEFLVFCMIEADAKSLREFRRARITTQLMTGTARRNIATAGLRARCVTAITGHMSVETRDNRHGHARA
jgi:hypothetical protein